jgi:hypothetical protein
MLWCIGIAKIALGHVSDRPNRRSIERGCASIDAPAHQDA